MDLKDRIKKARKEAGYKNRDTLADFLGSTRNAINEYEQGRVVPNDVFLQLMATKLNISYEWLKYGKGEMRTVPDSLAAMLDAPTLDATDKEIMKIYISLSPSERQVLRNFALQIAKVATPPTPAPKKREQTIDEKVAAYRAELEAEEKAAARQPASADTDGAKIA